MTLLCSTEQMLSVMMICSWEVKADVTQSFHL